MADMVDNLKRKYTLLGPILSDLSRLVMSACLYDQVGNLLWSHHKAHNVMAPALRKACNFINGNLVSDTSIATLATRCGASTRTLRRLASCQLGCSLNDYRIKCRVYEATRQLQVGIPIKHVSQSIGYQSESGFFSAFKSIMGTTPARFQKNQTERLA